MYIHVSILFHLKVLHETFTNMFRIILQHIGSAGIPRSELLSFLPSHSQCFQLHVHPSVEDGREEDRFQSSSMTLPFYVQYLILYCTITAMESLLNELLPTDLLDFMFTR